VSGKVWRVEGLERMKRLGVLRKQECLGKQGKTINSRRLIEAKRKTIPLTCKLKKTYL